MTAGFLDDPRLSALLDLVDDAARSLRDARAEGVRVDRKAAAVDLVTEVDRRLQRELVTAISAQFPGETIVGEEQDDSETPHREPAVDERAWYVDPLDGTTNFVHGHPFHAISVACWTGSQAELAVVASPALGETFLAARGRGSHVRTDDGTWHRLPGSDCPALRDALLATGFPYDRGTPARLTLACCAHALARARGLRRTGSASLDLCYVAAGRLDGFFELTLKPWDVAAGSLIATEAGLTVTDFRGEQDHLWGQRICVANPAVHPELLALLAEAHADPEHWPVGSPLRGPVPLHPEERP